MAVQHIFQNKDVYWLAWTQVQLWMKSSPFLSMSYVQYLETRPFIPSSVFPSIPRMFGLAVLQNCRGKGNTNVFYPSEGLGGKPRVWEKLGTEAFQNYCQIWGSGPPPQMKMKIYVKQAVQSPTWGIAYSRAAEDGGTTEAPLIQNVVTNGSWLHVLWRRYCKA